MCWLDRPRPRRMRTIVRRRQSLLLSFCGPTLSYCLLLLNLRNDVGFYSLKQKGRFWNDFHKSPETACNGIVIFLTFRCKVERSSAADDLPLRRSIGSRRSEPGSRRWSPGPQHAKTP